MIKTITHTDVEALLRKAQEVTLTLTELSVYCRNLGLRPANLMNTLSVEVSRRFVVGKMSYETGDVIMNSLFSAIIELSMDEDMPQPAFDIYLAFDEGEYQHRGDSAHIAPSERYTRPHLLEILRGLADTE